MRIGYNARLLAEADLRGWNRYTVNLLEAIQKQGVEPVLFSDKPIHPDHLARLPGAIVRIAPAMSYDRWEQIWLPSQSKRDRVALLHSPFNFGLPWTTSVPRVLTLHDAIDQVFVTPKRRRPPKLARVRESFRHWSSRTRAHRIITVSEHARSDLVHHLRIPDHKIVVIAEAADPRFHQPISDVQSRDVMCRHRLTAPYIFYIGGWELRKNIPFLLEAFSQAKLEGVELVIAGGNETHRQDLTNLGERLGLGPRLRLIGRVEDVDLPAIYARALGFVYPSRYEGFGLQLCEAMAVGCPILASDQTSLPEVLGNGGETFPIDNPRRLADLIRRLGTDTSYRNELSRRSRSRSLSYSWNRTAEATLGVYQDLGAR